MPPSALSRSLLATLLAALLVALLVALLASALSACAIADEPAAPAPDPGTEERARATDAPLQTLACEPYDPSYCDETTSCEVGSQYVQCNSGVTMYAYWTPDCRWCIPRDVCGWTPPVCPF